jgi:predicted aspartyl protease
VPKVFVDTGSEHTWIPERVLRRIGIVPEKRDVIFVMANGSTVTRDVGFAIIRVDDYFTVDEAAFANKDDLVLLEARTLEGLRLRPDTRRKKLVAAGPHPAA